MANLHERPSAHPWAVLAVLSLGTFMTLLDLTIVNIAIPSMVDGLRASLDQILWVLNAYSLLYAVLLITSGRLGDILGPRTLFIAGMAVFTAASAVSGMAHDPLQLIIARAGQGFGAALLAPQGLPFITSLFPAERRAGPFALIGMLAGLAVLFGPILGGFIIANWGWRWIFYVNIPIGILTLVLAALVIPDLRPGRRHRLDLLGVLLASAGLFGLVFGLIEGQRYNWGTIVAPITIPAIIGVGALLLVLFLVVQYRRQDAEPLLPFTVFANRNYTLLTLVLAAMGFAMLGLFLPLTIYLQSVLGLSALNASLTMAPMAVAMLLISPVSNALISRVGAKSLLLVGLLLFAAGMAYIAWAVHVDSPRWAFLPGLIPAGVGMACIWGPAFSLATRDLKPEMAGVASGILNTLQELGGVIASASVGALLQNRLATALHEQAVSYSGQLPAQFRPAFVTGFSQAASNGLQVGAGQTGGNVTLPPGVPAPVVQQLEHLATAVFTHAFVAAMRPTMLLPLAVILLAALSCLALQRPTQTPPAGEQHPTELEPLRTLVGAGAGEPDV
jgi:EmrB/QacA subfamily drug resistance transporter